MAEENDSSRGLIMVGLGALAVALMGGAFYSAFAPPPGSAPAVARPPPVARPSGAPVAPDFSLPRLDGSRVTLSALRGKVVVIDFWATWCPPCRAEMPWLVAMGKRLESRGVVFVAIDEDDPPGQVPLVTEFTKEVPGLERFAVMGDPEIEERYGVSSLPTLFVVDRQGQLVQRFVGQADEATVVAFVERVAGQ